MSGISGYLGSYPICRVNLKRLVSLKYRVIPEITGYPITHDFQNYTGWGQVSKNGIGSKRVSGTRGPCIQEQKQQHQDCRQLEIMRAKTTPPPKKIANNTGDLSRATMLAALSNLASCSSTALKAVLRLVDFTDCQPIQCFSTAAYDSRSDECLIRACCGLNVLAMCK